MLEFLQAYWGWIVFGLLFVLMMRMHGGGGGCGMGHSHSQHDQHTENETRANVAPPQDSNAAGGANWERDREKTPAGSHSGGCH